jgi:hypothetical protein
VTPAALAFLAAAGLFGFALGVVGLRSDTRSLTRRHTSHSRAYGLFALLAVAALVATAPFVDGWFWALNLLLVRPVARRVARSGVRSLTH